jgi:hypothetical protein
MNNRARFGAYNYHNLSTVFSSELLGFEGINTLTPHRSNAWITEGHYEITASNQNIYINDGSDKTVAIPIGDYDTGADLATAITTALNTSSSGWTVTYNTTVGYGFNFIRSSPAILRFSQQTNALWDDIGFTGVIDSASTTVWDADEMRNHTSEWFIVDAGASVPVKMFCMVSDVDLPFDIATTATVNLYGNNADVWTSPALTVTGDVTERGIFWNIDEDTFSTYRFWKFEWVDRTNTNGPNFAIGVIYVGDIDTFTTTNVARGFVRNIVDPSLPQVSESGTTYYDIRTPYETFNNLNIQNVTETERDVIKYMFDLFGVHTPFFVSLDPFNQFSANTDEYSRFVKFETPPVVTHKFVDYYDVTMSLREAV